MLLALVMLGGRAVFGQAKVGNLTYSLDGAIHTAIVTGADSLVKFIVIPEKIGVDGVTYIVNEIKSKAFQGHKYLESVQISGNIKTISSYAFENCKKLEQVWLDEGVQGIATRAFGDCVALTKLNFPSTLEQIGTQAFQGCTGLKTLNFNEGLKETGDRSFQCCTSLEEVKLPKSFTKLGNWTFEFCSGLKKVVLGENTTYLGNRALASTAIEEITFKCKPTYANDAFYSCNSIERIYLDNVTLSDWLTIDWKYSAPTLGHMNDIYVNGKLLVDLVVPNDVEKIANCTLYNNRSLKSVRIPANVTEIANDVFNGTKIDRFIIEDSDKKLTVGTMFRYMEADTIHFGRAMGVSYQVNPAVKSVSFGDNFNTLYAYLFKNCSKLEKLDLNKVTVIELEAFNNCGVLSEVNLGYPTLIDDNAFANCTISRLKCNTITPPTLKTSAFNDITIKAAQLEVPEGTKSAYAAAEVWKKFMRVIEPNTQWLDKEITLTSAGTLMNKLSLNDIERIRSLKLSGDINGTDILLINKMINMESLDLSGANIKSGGMPYYEDDKTSAVTKDNELNRYWSYGLSYLKELKLPATLKSIGDYGCENLPFIKSMFIPKSITNLGERVFNNATSLSELYIEDSDEWLNVGRYNSLNISKLYFGRNIKHPSSGMRLNGSLKSVTISPCVTQIYGYIFGASANTYVNNLERVDISDLEAWCKITIASRGDSPLWSGAKLYLNGELIEDFVFPTTLDKVLPNTFAGCRQLKSAYFSGQLKSIGNDVFNMCSNLNQVYLPSSVNSIGAGAFANSGLTSIKLPYSIDNIADYLFDNCVNLTEISIPASVKKVGANAFTGCTSLKKVTVANQIPPTMNDKSFNDVAFTDIPLYIPKESTFIYYLHPFWSKFRTRQELEGGYFDVKPILFSIDETNGNEAIITASNEVTGDVVIPATVEQNGKTYVVTSITPESFKDNTAITSVSIPASVKYIGYDAFNGCTNLTEVTLGAPAETARGKQLAPAADGEEIDATVIGENAFAGCTNIKVVDARWQVPPRAPESAFASEVYAAAVLKAPSNVFDDYRNSEYCWSKFTNAVAGVDDISADDKEGTGFTVENGTITFDPSMAGENVEIYNLSGTAVYRGAASTVRLDRGLYIVWIGNKAVKVVL